MKSSVPSSNSTKSDQRDESLRVFGEAQDVIVPRLLQGFALLGGVVEAVAAIGEHGSELVVVSQTFEHGFDLLVRHDETCVLQVVKSSDQRLDAFSCVFHSRSLSFFSL